MNDTPERWLPVVGYEGRYDVSDLGRVRSWLPWHSTPIPRTLKGSPDKDGYLGVALRKDGRTTQWKNHLLVMLAFVGPRPEGLETRHFDGNHLNNRLKNLRYGTSSENSMDTVRHGTNRNARKIKCLHGHPFNTKNTYIRPSGGRDCPTCRQIWDRERLLRKKAARAKKAA